MGFEIGREVVIDQGHPTEEVNIIAGFGSLLLATPLKYPHGPGASVIQLHTPPVPIQAMTQQELIAVEKKEEKILDNIEQQALMSGAPPPVGDLAIPPPGMGGMKPLVSFEEEQGFGAMPLLQPPSLMKGMRYPLPTTTTPITTYSSATSLLGGAVKPVYS